VGEALGGDDNTGLVKGLGLLDATALVMGSMIGSGIFVVPADIARQLQSPGLILVVWVATAFLTLVAALSYGELAAAFPKAGGQYVYLREAFGPLSGFLYGWTLFAVIQTGTIAAVAVAFAKFLGIFVPAISAQRAVLPYVSTQQLTAIVVIVALSWVNSRGLRAGAWVQNIFTFAKTAALLAVVAAGLFAVGANAAGSGELLSFPSAGGSFWDMVKLVGVAMVGSLFSSDAWNNVTFTAGEVRNPRRNVPLSLALGVGVVSALYLATNVAYLRVLPLEAIQHAPEDRVATAFASALGGQTAALWMAAAIVVSTFGCLNGIILAGARVYYAMALDGLFFTRAAQLHPTRHTPTFALLIQCVWAVLLTLSGTYGDLLDYVIFAVLLFYILTIAGIFVLRWRQPELPRPYRAFGYPVVPALYILLAGVVSALLLVYKPRYTWPGLGLVLLGVPIYAFWRRSAAARLAA
jgi:APA family basic amino acid/polyamine antiporter